MRRNLRQSEAQGRELDLSIIQDLPENNKIEVSFLTNWYKGHGIFVRPDLPRSPHMRFKSLISPRGKLDLEDFSLRDSMMSGCDMGFFDAIEKTLLMQNENLKNHNKYLLSQMKKMINKQKKLKKIVISHQNKIEQLSKMNQERANNLNLLSADITILIQSIGLNANHNDSTHTQQHNPSLPLKNISQFDRWDTDSQTVSQSLQIIKKIFNRSEFQNEEQHDQYDLIHYPPLDHQGNSHQSQFNDLCTIAMGPNQFNPDSSRKIGKNIRNQPSFKNLQMKITSLCNQISKKERTNKNAMSCNNIRTTGQSQSC